MEPFGDRARFGEQTNTAMGKLFVDIRGASLAVVDKHVWKSCWIAVVN